MPPGMLTRDLDIAEAAHTLEPRPQHTRNFRRVTFPSGHGPNAARNSYMFRRRATAPANDLFEVHRGSPTRSAANTIRNGSGELLRERRREPLLVTVGRPAAVADEQAMSSGDIGA